jgi:transcriptional regulator with XRE-family HTH domain
MSQTQQLVETLKRVLKSKGINYAQIAEHLGLSEASVKRQFSQLSFSLRTLEAICERAQLDLAELVQAAEDAQLDVHQLRENQEADLVADPKRLLVAVCVLNQMTLAQIIAQYRLTKAECIAQLLRLDRLQLIRLLPENRVKLKISRDFQWISDGPIQRFFRTQAQTDFLNANFGYSGELYRFQHGMLTPAANQRFQQRLLRLQQEFAELHKDCISAPVEERFGTSVLVAMRPWELAAFEALRRQPDARAFLTEGNAQSVPQRRTAGKTHNRSRAAARKSNRA